MAQSNTTADSTKAPKKQPPTPPKKGQSHWRSEETTLKSEEVTARRNSSIKEIVRSMYTQFVDEVDPKDVFDLLIQENIISIGCKHELMGGKTREDRCRDLLDHLLTCSHSRALIVFRKALEDRYSWIAKRIDDSVKRAKREEQHPITKSCPNLEKATRNIDGRTAQSKITSHHTGSSGFCLPPPLSSRPILLSPLHPASKPPTHASYLPIVPEHRLSFPSYRASACAPVASGPLILNTIREPVSGIAMLENMLYVLRLGSTSIEVYDGNKQFNNCNRPIVISPSDGKFKKVIRKVLDATHLRKADVSSGLQDIACCQLNRRLYASDVQRRCVYCVDPLKRKVEHTWSVESGEPWGISTTPGGNVVVSCRNSGQLCEYSGEGNLVSTVHVKMAHDSPWQGFPFGTLNSWVLCHGGRDSTPGYVRFADSSGNYLGGYNEIRFQDPSHLAILPDNRMLVAERGRNRIVLLGPSSSVQEREILNHNHGINAPVRLHYCESSGELIVGQSDGSIFIYRINDILRMYPRSTSLC